jgi:hypothetical protein
MATKAARRPSVKCGVKKTANSSKPRVKKTKKQPKLEENVKQPKLEENVKHVPTTSLYGNQVQLTFCPFAW